MQVSFGVPQMLGFLYGLSSTLFINVGGQLYVCELLATLVVLSVGPTKILAKDRPLQWIMLAYGCVLMGLLVSDALTNNPTRFAIRGWANIGFAAINVLFLVYLLRRNVETVLWVLAGAALARIIQADVNDLREALEGGNRFKVQVAPVLSPLLVIVLYKLSDRVLVVTSAAIAIGVVYTVLGARSAALIFFLAAGFLFRQQITTRGGQRAIASAMLICIGYLGYLVYVDSLLATADLTSHGYQQLVRTNNPYNPFELLAQGRAEFQVALYAIQDSWLIGRGSWARDVTGEFAVYQAQLTGARTVYYNPIIPAHSVILTAWLWGGLLSLIGIVFFTFVVLRLGFIALSAKTRWRPVVAYLLAGFLWNVLFSPLGHIRTSFPLAIALVLVVAGSAAHAHRTRHKSMKT